MYSRRSRRGREHSRGRRSTTGAVCCPGPTPCCGRHVLVFATTADARAAQVLRGRRAPGLMARVRGMQAGVGGDRHARDDGGAVSCRTTLARTPLNSALAGPLRVPAHARQRGWARPWRATPPRAHGELPLVLSLS